METGNLPAVMLSIGMIAAFVLLIAGGRLALKVEDRKRGVLMMIAGLVLIANVLIWAWPAG